MTYRLVTTSARPHKSKTHVVSFGDSASNPGSTPGISTIVNTGSIATCVFFNDARRMLPLRICFLWHQHQPDYRADGRFFLPWVRLHAAKDYSDLLLIMRDYPLVHTVNVVPSLISQLEDYEAGLVDVVQELCEIPSEEFTYDQQEALLTWVRTLQFQTMVSPFPKFKRIWEESVTNGNRTLSEQEITNLKGMFNLAWVGPVSRANDARLCDMMESNRDFTTLDVAYILDVHIQLCKKFMQLLNDSQSKGAVEVSITPFYHPILPLLVDTDVAFESNLNSMPLATRFAHIDSADRQVKDALSFWSERSVQPASGMWSAEGAISEATLDILARHSVRWTASDETVLRKSLAEEWDETATFFPYEMETRNGEIGLLFRDHSLSDAIGFEYAGWDPTTAAHDFVRRLESRRSLIVMHHGEQGLSNAIVPIFLDGENCWEFYHGNGEQFLRAMFELLANNQRFETVTCTQAIQSTSKRVLHKLIPGSWINGDFEVWIGTEVKNLAWKLLGEAHQAVAGMVVDSVPPSVLQQLHNTLMILEASDWYWWYHGQHQAQHKDRFDEMFRHHLQFVFTQTGTVPTTPLDVPLARSVADGQSESFPVVFSTGAMHEANALCKSVVVLTQDSWQRITFHLYRAVDDGEQIDITISDEQGMARKVMLGRDHCMIRSAHHDEGVELTGSASCAIYLHTEASWNIEIQEQRRGGFTAQTFLRIFSSSAAS